MNGIARAPRASRVRRTARALGPALFALAVTVGAAASASAQSLVVALPADCGDEALVRARLGELGVSGAEDASLTISVGPGWSGLLRGELRVEQRGRVLERTIEDDSCADVRDALSIAAALALRELRDSGTTPIDHGPDVLELRLGERGGPPSMRAPPPRGPEIRGAIGLEGRLGVGPVPGLSAAPGVLGVLGIDAFFAAAHAVWWPESAARSAAGAVGLWALAATLELGARTPGSVGVTLAAALEAGVVAARGQPAAGARDATAGLLDAGLAVGLDGRVGPISLFLRTDLLFALLRPAYLLGDVVAFEAPALRAAISVGVLFWPGS